MGHQQVELEIIMIRLLDLEWTNSATFYHHIKKIDWLYRIVQAKSNFGQCPIDAWTREINGSDYTVMEIDIWL